MNKRILNGAFLVVLLLLALPTAALGDKLVTAILKPFKLDDVREALSEVGVTGLP